MGWAFVEPTEEKVDYIVSRMPDTSTLDDATMQEFERAMLGLVGDFDANIRTVTQDMANGAGQSHYFAIRALNTPSTPGGFKKNVQLVGQEYFGVNRFFPALIDIADVEFWGLYEDGDWELHTWNTHGEHLMVGSKGIGKLKTGYFKVNGAYLGSEEVISFMHSFNRRANGNFARYNDHRTIQYTFSQLDQGQQPLERRLKQLRDLNLIDENDEATYISRSIGTPQQAEDRCHQDLKLKDLRKGYQKLPNATDLGAHGNTDDIKAFYKQNSIEALVKKKDPLFDDVQKFLKLEREAYLKFGISLSDIHLVDWPGLLDYSTLGSQNINSTQRQKNTASAFQKIRDKLGI